MRLALAACFAALALPAAAQDFGPQLQAYLEEQIVPWTADPVIVEAIRSRNAETAAYDQARIDALDSEWRAAVSAPATPVIAGILDSAASAHLRALRDASGGTIAEIIVMDARGLNAAISDLTSDYWQGDEAKHAQTYGKGPGATFVGEVEFDESTQRFVGQISVTVTDPETGDAIGAITVGVDAEALM